MKHIKLFCFLILVSLPLHSEQNQDIENYFLKVYENEKLEFLDCVDQEGLELDKQINTKCKISSMAKDAAYFLYDKKSLTPSDFLDQFSRYRSIKKQPPIYPRRAQGLGTEGYAIVSFTITETGSVEDAKSIEGWCGNVRNPYTQYQPCNIFNQAAVRAAKNFKYEPTKINGRGISTKNILHRYTFLMEGEYFSIKKNRHKAYNNILKEIEKNNFDKAVSTSIKNLEFDYIFMNLIASANFQQGKYLDAKDWSVKFKDELIKEGRGIPEDIVIRSFIILVSSLFNLGEYQEIIALEEQFNDYNIERTKFNELLAITNLYFGVSFINIGDLHNGAKYLGSASKYSGSKAESDYIDSVINQISSYL